MLLLTAPALLAMPAAALSLFPPATSPARAVAERTPYAAAPAVWGDFPPLPRVAGKLARGDGSRIVAFGSSSTAGAGASAPDRAYPAQLERLLRDAYPGQPVQVLNRGAGGETVAANLRRLDADVLAAVPDLVIWQAGTNDALRGVPAPELRAGLLEGIARVRAIGADLVLLDSQPLPEPERDAAVRRAEAVLLDVARAAKVPLLPRRALMLHWLQVGSFAPGTLLGPDGLHMTDASYRCLAVRIADLFAPAKRP